ncbi:MAG: metallophosphoesterase [Candidatus Hydrothermarchaeota archaeon]
MFIQPVFGNPALIIKSSENILVIADIHLGIEHEFRMGGLKIKSQTEELKNKIIDLINDFKIERLILLGDIKHNIPTIPKQEIREIPSFLEALTSFTKVEILPGNHDGGIDKLTPPGVEIRDRRGIMIDEKIGLLHGQTWPKPELFESEILIIGHNHPKIKFKDELGGSSKEPAWIRSKVDRKILMQSYPQKRREEYFSVRLEEVMIMPAFNPLVGGIYFNKINQEELLGPILRAGCLKLNEADVYLLDGTYLGKVNNL